LHGRAGLAAGILRLRRFVSGGQHLLAVFAFRLPGLHAGGRPAEYL
jgi:hypothetical protein